MDVRYHRFEVMYNSLDILHDQFHAAPSHVRERPYNVQSRSLSVAKRYLPLRLLGLRRLSVPAKDRWSGLNELTTNIVRLGALARRFHRMHHLAKVAESFQSRARRQTSIVLF
jgi:hypothetical protein